jgi:hypothetical protein
VAGVAIVVMAVIVTSILLRTAMWMPVVGVVVMRRSAHHPASSHMPTVNNSKSAFTHQ